jgi:hypothetical protein
VSPNSRRSKESAIATSAAWAAGPRSPLIGKLFDEATLTNASNVGAIFSVFKPFEERDAQGLTTDVILASINKRLAAIDGAFVITILPPPINGIGNAGGFKMMLEDKKNLGPDALEAAAQELAAAANADPRLAGVFTALRQHHTQCLCRYRPFPGRQAGRAAAASFRGAADLPGFGLHQRLQLSGWLQRRHDTGFQSQIFDGRDRGARNSSDFNKCQRAYGYAFSEQAPI